MIIVSDVYVILVTNYCGLGGINSSTTTASSRSSSVLITSFNICGSGVREREQFLRSDPLKTNVKMISFISSSSSYRAGSTDIPDPLSPLLPIVHRSR